MLKRGSWREGDHLPSEVLPEGEKKEDQPVHFEIIIDPEMRQQLRDRTQELVDLVQKDQDDVVIFLDKSARPISWIFKEVWRSTCPDLPLPIIRFVNIGSNSRVRRADTTEKEAQASGDLAQELSGIFGDQFDGKSLMIVDELHYSGRSLRHAQDAFRNAFPAVSGVHGMWMFKAEEHSHLPWMTIPGATDVMDFKDKTISRSITEDSVKERVGDDQGFFLPDLYRIKMFVHGERRKRTGRSLEKIAKNPNLYDWRERLESVADRVKMLLSKGAKEVEDYVAIQSFSVEAKALLDDIRVDHSSGGKLFRNVYEDLKQARQEEDHARVRALREVEGYFFDLHAELRDVFDRGFLGARGDQRYETERAVILGALSRPSSLDHHIQPYVREEIERVNVARAFEQRSFDPAVKKLKEHARQLRAEMLAIAKLPPSPPRVTETS